MPMLQLLNCYLDWISLLMIQTSKKSSKEGSWKDIAHYLETSTKNLRMTKTLPQATHWIRTAMTFIGRSDLDVKKHK